VIKIKFYLVCVSCISFSLANFSAHAQNLSIHEATLKLITDTAAQICTMVPIEGTNENIDLTGDAQAKLNSTIKKFVDLGLEGAAKFQSGEYKGVLREQLAIAIKNGNDCKLSVFNTLLGKLAPPIGISSSGVSGSDAISLPTSPNPLDSIDTGNFGIGPHTIDYYRCNAGVIHLFCLLKITRRGNGTYEYGEGNVNRQVLIDNFGVEHHLVKFYFVNGRGGRQQNVNLGKDDGAWMGEEFDNGAKDIISARIVFTGLNGAQLKGPVTP
jgi:hypothetical protein